MVGRQQGANESNGNLDYLYEYDSTLNRWRERARMIFPRGHFSSSTVPDRRGCGFFIVGGAINGGIKTPDVHYYSIQHNNWTKIGELPSSRNTPVCVTTVDNFLYCQSGNLLAKFAWRTKIIY
jgi:N-acetylneuraminic acid mutarotase